jgi:hypothetical protein
MNPSTSFCPDCHQPVIRARTEALRWQLLDPDPDEGGNVHARKDHNGNWLARSVKPRTPAVFPEVLMMPHPPTCPKRQPAPPQLPAGVTGIDAYRRRRVQRAALKAGRGGRR